MRDALQQAMHEAITSNGHCHSSACSHESVVSLSILSHSLSFEFGHYHPIRSSCTHLKISGLSPFVKMSAF